MYKRQSLRRLAHYDYWSDKLKRSILLDSGADIVSYGMGERSIVEIADALAAGLSIEDVTFIDGTVYKTRSLDYVYDAVTLPSYEQMRADKLAYAKSFGVQYRNSDPFTGKRLVEEYPHGVYVVQNPPSKPLSRAELDAVYRLPYARTYHPMYEEAGGVPAISEVKFSLASSRGCFGECSFCALTFHPVSYTHLDVYKRQIQLYEMGTVFSAHEGAQKPKERRKLAGVLAGAMHDASWNCAPAAFDFFDGKGVLEQIARELALPKVRFKALSADEAPHLQPGRAAQMLAGGDVVGWVGEIHPLAAEAFDAAAPVVAFELDMACLLYTSRCV